MICKKCSYVLFGSEAFCPNCGAKCEKEAENTDGDFAQKAATERETPPHRPERKPQDVDIFSSEPVYVYSKDYEEKKKGHSGLAVTFVVTFLITLVAVGGFIAADYFGLIPAISALLPTKEQTTTLPLVTTTLHSDFDDSDGVVPPQISFKPVLCFVSSENNLSLRKGPGDAYAQLSALPVGTQVQVIGGSVTESNWVYAYVPVDDSYGWLCSSFLSTENAFAGEIDNNQ